MIPLPLAFHDWAQAGVGNAIMQVGGLQPDPLAFLLTTVVALAAVALGLMAAVALVDWGES